MRVLGLALFLVECSRVVTIQKTDETWERLQPPLVSSTRFTPRNSHATCVFKGNVWLTGGRTTLYTRYNLKPGYKAADVWRSQDGLLWTQESSLKGDFYAQNADAIQPGPIAPWYPRFGHTLTAVDLDGDGASDVMIQLGGFAPTPSNDIWITEDGVTWIFCGHAPWEPRAWHSALVFADSLFVLGGTPLNNDVWSAPLSSIRRVARAEAPLTRAMYLDYSYALDWVQRPHAPWSPRCAMGAVAQWHFNASAQTKEQGASRLVLMGGYGGWLDQTSASFPYKQGVYDGIRTRGDVWSMGGDGDWVLLSAQAEFGARGWFSAVTLDSKLDYRVDIASNRSARVMIVGGGSIGYSTSSTARTDLMSGKVDAYISRDCASWERVNYQEGGGTSLLSLYSSQEWAKTTIEGSILYLGLWGMTVVLYDFDKGSVLEKRRLLMIAGDQTANGVTTNIVYRSLHSLLCERDGVTCANRGSCSPNTSSCVCNTIGSVTYTGEYCEDLILNPSSAMLRISLRSAKVVAIALAGILFGSILVT